MKPEIGGYKMRSLVLVLLFLLPVPSAFAQEKEKWQRMITLDDSAVDMNVSTVVFSTGGTERVQFRFSRMKAEPVPGMPESKYKSFIETVEFNCYERLYRVYEITYFDGKGKAIRTDEKDASAKWKPERGRGFIERLYDQTCQFIQEKRRNP
jgi:hypothetical protein